MASAKLELFLAETSQSYSLSDDSDFNQRGDAGCGDENSSSSSAKLGLSNKSTCASVVFFLTGYDSFKLYLWKLSPRNDNSVSLSELPSQSSKV